MPESRRGSRLDDGPLARVGVVVIGRNEGARLPRCFGSLPFDSVPVVYVDSGSSDNSVETARAAGAHVVELDPSSPFTAARARNAGFDRILERRPDLELVQFVDGDCALDPSWLETAALALRDRPELVAVHGHLHEMFPDASVYNRLCDIEWGRVPPGESTAFGGLFMVRTTSFRRVGGFDPAVIAAEDDDLAIRLRRAGGRLAKLDATAAYHDAAMTRISQWWRRALRCGHAYAHVADLHGNTGDTVFVGRRRSTLLWGLALPAHAFGLVLPTAGLSLALLGLYPLQALRVAWKARRSGLAGRDALLWGVSCVAAKVPEAAGVALYYVNRGLGKRSHIIEHKGAGADGVRPE